MKENGNKLEKWKIPTDLKRKTLGEASKRRQINNYNYNRKKEKKSKEKKQQQQQKKSNKAKINWKFVATNIIVRKDIYIFLMLHCNQQHHHRLAYTSQRFSESIIYLELS